MQTGERMRVWPSLLLLACSPPCEAPDIEQGYEPTADVHFELVVLVDGTTGLDAARETLRERWSTVVQASHQQRTDGEAAYLHESVSIRFLPSAPGCAARSCDGASVAHWERLAPDRDDRAFDELGLCLWDTTARCDVFQPLDVLAEHLESGSPARWTNLFVILVTERDDASIADPVLLARRVADLGTRRVGIVGGVQINRDGIVAAACEGTFAASPAPRLAAFANELTRLAVRVYADGCMPPTGALGYCSPTLDHRGRGLPPLATLAGCTLEETLSERGRVTSCGQVAHLGREWLRNDEAGREVCAVTRSADGGQPGWLRAGAELQFAPGSEPVAEAVLRFRCGPEAGRCNADADCHVGSAVDESPRCDPVHRVCESACWSASHCLEGHVCGGEELDGQSWCSPGAGICIGT